MVRPHYCCFSISSLRQAAALLLCLSACLGLRAEAGPSDPSAIQRQLFRSAWSAVQKGQLPPTAVQQQLQDYVLYPYIQARILAARLQNGLTPELDQEIERFIAQEGFTPASSMLYRRWLIHLAQGGQWERFLMHYAVVQNDEPINASLHCYRAQLAIEQRNNQLARTLGLVAWRSGRTQDPACDPVFAWLEAQGAITEKLFAERLDNALRLHNDSLARQMAARLPPARAQAVLKRVNLMRLPAAQLPAQLAGIQDPDALLVGLVRLAAIDPATSQNLLSQARSKRMLSATQQAVAQRALAISWAQRHDPAGQSLLGELPPSLLDEAVLTWGFRDALWHGDWTLAAKWLGALEPAQQRERAWRYWMIRIHGDDLPEARATYRDLATWPDYYGILAWNRLTDGDKPAPWLAPATKPDPTALRGLNDMPQAQRAREWLFLNNLPEARRAWQDLLARLNSTLRQQAALLALSWHWDSEAVAAMRGLDPRYGLDVRYPTPYRDLVFSRADQFSIPQSWVYAIMRSESLFRPDVASYAGALGLMQLMPATAGDMARKLKLGSLNQQGILTAERNVLLGSAYLGELASRFESNVALATAAYHAGPNRVSRWLPPHAMSMDVWVDNVPIEATREYVRNVVRDYAIYSGRLGMPIALRRFDLPAPKVIMADETPMPASSASN